MHHSIPGITLRAVLQAIQNVSGPQYTGLLRQAGIERYRTALPAADDPAACSIEELVALYTAVYEMLGPTVTRLFHRNCGIALAAISREMPSWTNTIAQAQTIPEAQRLEWFVRLTAKQLEAAWTRAIITEDARAWYVAMEQCYTCQGIQGATMPICMAGETLYPEMAKQLLGWRVRVTEVACHAMGAKYCTYAFDKATRPLA
jgi:hypothetical protein